MTQLTTKSQIQKLQNALSELPQAEVSLKHTFIEGVYTREMFMFAGTVLAGKTHLREHILVIPYGTVAIVSEEYEGVVQAPFTLKCNAGAKRAVTAITDSVMLTIHRTDKTEIADIEKELVSEE